MAVRRHHYPRSHTPVSPPPRGVDIALLLGTSLEDRWRRVMAELRRNQRRCSEESIHDLRVAMRRMMATIDVVLMVVPLEGLRKARRSLRKYLRSFNELRDTHIQILAVRGLTRRFPALRPLRLDLLRRQRVLVGRARRRIREIPAPAIEQAVAAASQALQNRYTTPMLQSIGRTIVHGALGAAFATAVERRVRLTAADTTTIHRLRVAFKKCRYMTEVLQPLLPSVRRKVLKQMNVYQTRLGAVQDAVVLTASVNRFALRRRRGSSLTFMPVHLFLAERQKQAIDDVMKSADELYPFWRSSEPSAQSGSSDR